MKKRKEIYFEDIFSRVIKIWRPSYHLQYGNSYKTFIVEMAEDYRKYNWEFVPSPRNYYSSYHSMFFFTIYQVLTEYGLQYLAVGKEHLDIAEIPIEAFEAKYHENLQYDYNYKFLRYYKGFRSGKEN